MRLHRSLGAITVGALLLGTAGNAVAQDSTPPVSGDIAVRGNLAAIALDSSALPDGYTFEGETFLTGDQLGIEGVSESSLADAGFEGYYVSQYTNASDGTTIRSYASAWGSADAVQGGFDILEDEGTTAPDGTFEDAETDLGSAPSELTTGTYPDATDADLTIGVADVTFTVDQYLVGVALETSDGSDVDTETVNGLAETLQSRAESVVGGTAPEGTDLALPGETLDISGFGTFLQAGFLNASEAEALLGLSGSALSGFNASWVESAALGSGDTLTPIVTVATTTFADDAKATDVVGQAADLTPNLDAATTVDDVSVDGASGVSGIAFSSAAVEGDDVDSFRLVYAEGSTVYVIDVQGAADAAAAQAAAEALASAEPGTAPEIPSELAASA